MALNPPLLKLYDCVSLALNNIYKFVKRQGYIVLTFRLNTNKQLLYYGPSVISVTVTKGGHLSSSRLYGTSRTIGRGVSRVM